MTVSDSMLCLTVSVKTIPGPVLPGPLGVSAAVSVRLDMMWVQPAGAVRGVGVGGVRGAERGAWDGDGDLGDDAERLGRESSARQS